jgi:hypothetical protein
MAGLRRAGTARRLFDTLRWASAAGIARPYISMIVSAIIPD